jgi:hypothetical protein
VNKAWRAFEADPLEGMAEGPYPGLRPFLPRERDIFFGREQMIDQVLVRLNEQHMVVVHGASGCGKSSLIAAGVLPQLARRRARRGLVLKTGTFRPGIQPMQSLVGLIGELCGTEAGPAPLDAVYRAISGGTGAARAGVARLAAAAGVDQLCIVIDQFEELFRFAEDEGFEEAQRFADLLVQLCGGGDEEDGWWEAEGGARPAEPVPAEISFILTMRSEFLGNCSRYPGLAEAINRTQYLLPNMGRSDLIRAIREPAEVFEGNVHHALAERMADDALREEDSLPLIQHALMQMWLASETGRLGTADYARALEGSAQSGEALKRGPLGAILAGHADRVLAETTAGDPAKQRAVEFIFRALSRKDSESRAIRFPQRYWRLVRLSGVGEAETRAIVDAFRRDTVSFLTPYAAMTPGIEGETVIDISHEALIRTWPRMSDKAIDEQARPVGWIEREAQDAMLWRWLSVHADFFRSNPRAYLDGATTERLTSWFERIKERPDWVRPYLVKPTGKDEVTDEPEWQAVARLLKESHDRNWLDRTMLSRWRRLGWSSAVLLVLVLLVAGIGGTWLFRSFSGENDSLQASVNSLSATSTSLVRSTVETTLPQIGCTWLDVGEVSSEQPPAVSLRGVAGDRQNTEREIAAALARAGLAHARLDFTGVAPMTRAGCSALDTFRQAKGSSQDRISSSQSRFPMTSQGGGRSTASVSIDLNLQGLESDFALAGLETSGNLTPLILNRAAFRQILATSHDGRPLTALGGDRYRLTIDIDHQGWTGLLLLTGDGPFESELIAPPVDARSADWQTEFLSAVEERSWRLEMLWFEAVRP